MAVLTLRPNAPGDTTGTRIGGTSPAATRWESVCEVVPDEEATYVYITIGFYYDEYNLPDHTTEIDTIVGVKVVIRCRFEEEGKSGSAGCRIKTGGAGYYKSPNGDLSASYVNYSYEWTTNPRTGLLWTWDDIDALQAGVYLSATIPVNWPRCTQLYVEVEYGAPTVTIQATTDIAGTTATGNGTIVRVGLADVTQHGHCWSTSANPTIADSKTENGAAGVGAFTSAITELTPGTLYHVRPYATNSIGTAYGDDETFTTVAASTVTTDPATGRGAIAATINGTLNQDGGEACECGLEWGLDTGYGTTTPPQSKRTGETFSQVIGGLFPGTTYHFRAFATNSAGTSHGADRSFATALVISKAYALAREEL